MSDRSTEKLVREPTDASRVRDRVDQFARDLGEAGVGAATVRAYTGDVRAFLGWLALVSDALPTRSDVLEYRAHLVRNRAAPATVNRRLIAIRRWSTFLIARGEISRNPALDVDPVEEVDPGPRSLTRKQWLALLRVAEQDGARSNAIVQTLLGTGVRISELAALRMEDLEIGPRSGWLTVRYGKGGKLRRVPLPAEARRALAQWMFGRDYSFAECPPSSGPLWIGQRGPLTSKGIWRIITDLGKEAGIPDLTPHQLRHTYAQRVLAGVDAEGRNNQITHVQALLGHRSIKTTARYLRPTSADLEHAVNAALV